MGWSETEQRIEPVSSSPRFRRDPVLIGLLLIISVAIRARHLSRPLQGDEMISFSNMVLGRSFGEIVFGPFDGNNHLLNSLIMKIVHLGFGENPALMRLPNLLMTLLAILLLYIFVSRELGRPSGFTTALFFGLHPAMVLFSVSCRGYAGMVLFTLISSVWLLRLIRGFSWRRWTLCAISGFAAGGFHLFAVNVLVAQILVAALEMVHPGSKTEAPGAPRRAVSAPVAALVLLIAVSLPAMRLGSDGPSRYLFQTDFPAALVNFLGGLPYRTGLDPVSLILLIPAAAGFIALGGHRTARRYIALLALSPAALFALTSVAPVFTLHPRFFAYLLPFFCLLVAAGLQQFPGRVAAVFGTGAGLRGPARFIVWVCAIAISLTFVDRIRVPSLGAALIRAQEVVREFVDRHPDAHLLTNDPGFVRVRLRLEDEAGRVRRAPGAKAIRAYLSEGPRGAVYFIHVPQKRYTESDMIHYRGEVPPEVLYQRDDWLRGFLDRNAVLEIDLAPKLRIYDLTPVPVVGDADRRQ